MLSERPYAWVTLPELGTARIAANVAAVDGTIYVIGGYDGSGELDANEGIAYSISELRVAGISAAALYAGGVSVADLSAGGYSQAELDDLGGSGSGGSGDGGGSGGGSSSSGAAAVPLLPVWGLGLLTLMLAGATARARGPSALRRGPSTARDSGRLHP